MYVLVFINNLFVNSAFNKLLSLKYQNKISKWDIADVSH